MTATFQVNHLKNPRFSALQFSLVPNNTSTRTFPMGSHESPGTIPWNVVLVECSMFCGILSLCIVSLYMILILLPLSISTFENFTLMLGPTNVGSNTSAYDPGLGIILGWSFMLQVTS